MAEVPVQPQTTPNKKTFNWNLLGIVVIAAVVIGGLGYTVVVMNLFGSKEAKPPSNKITQCNQTPSKSDGISNWQLTETKKFLIKHPEGWGVKENQLDTTLIKGGTKIVFYNFAGDHLPAIKTRETQIDFAGQRVVAMKRLPGDDDPLLGESKNWNFLAKNGNCNATVVVTSPSAPEEQLNRSILLILSSIRIKDLEKKDLKVYKNEVLGVSFRYTGNWYGITIEDLYQTSRNYAQVVIRETQYRDLQALEFSLVRESQDSSYQSVFNGAKKTQIKIGGHDAFKLKKSQGIKAVLKKDNEYYTLLVRKVGENLLPIRNQEISEIFDQVVSTLKFLD